MIVIRCPDHGEAVIVEEEMRARGVYFITVGNVYYCPVSRCGRLCYEVTFPMEYPVAK